MNSQLPVEWYSLKILKEPSDGAKGAVIASGVDDLVNRYSKIKQSFYLIERRAWRGLNDSKHADIKLVEDLSYWEQTKSQFPDSVCLDIGPADFIDTNSFYPLETDKKYDGIQISSWTALKRPELLTLAAGILEQRTFIRWGHFQNVEDEGNRMRQNISLSKSLGAQITVPYGQDLDNKSLPKTSEEMNAYINLARIGILTTQIEGINRFKMECLSANVPVLVPSDASFPTQKHINSQTGRLYSPTPESLAIAIEETLSNLDAFRPRDYILKTTGKHVSLQKLKEGLRTCCERDNSEYVYDGITWDGRNQSQIWGENVFSTIEYYLKKQ